MTVIHKEHTFKQKARYKKLKPLALTPTIELKNKTIKVQSAGARPIGVRNSSSVVRRRATVSIRDKIKVDEAVARRKRIEESISRRKEIEKDTKDPIKEQLVSDSRNKQEDESTVIKQKKTKLEETLRNRDFVRPTISVTTKGGIAAKFKGIDDIRTSVEGIARVKVELGELSQQAQVSAADARVQQLSKIGEESRQFFIASQANRSSSAKVQRIKDEASIALQAIAQSCIQVKEITTSAIHDGIGTDRSAQSATTALKSIIDPIIGNINNKTTELNRAILESYTSVDSLVNKIKPILDKIQAISKAIVLLKNRITDLNAQRDALPSDINLTSFISNVSAIKSVLDAFSPTAILPSRNTKDSIKARVLNAFGTLATSIETSIGKISGYKQTISAAQTRLANTPANKSRAQQTYKSSINSASRLDPSVKQALKDIVNSHESDVGSVPSLTNRLRSENNVPVNNVVTPPTPNIVKSVDALKSDISSLESSYYPVPVKPRPPSVRLEISGPLKNLSDALDSARTDVNNVNTATGLAKYYRDLASGQKDSDYSTYTTILLVGAPSHALVDSATNSYNSAVNKYSSAIDGANRDASSDLATIYGSLPSYFHGRKSVAGSTKTSKKAIAAELKGGFTPRAVPVDFKPKKPDRTEIQTKRGTLTGAESSRLTLEKSNLNLNVNSRLSTKLKDKIIMVLGNFNNRYTSNVGYNRVRDSFSDSKGSNNSSKRSSNQNKTSTKDQAKLLADGVKETLRIDRPFSGKRTSFLGNLRETVRLKDSVPSKKASLREAEFVLITIKHNEVTVSEIVKIQLSSKIRDFQALKEAVDNAIHDISMKPEVVRDTPNTTRQQNARQDALDKLSRKVAELDLLVSLLGSTRESINAHILQKLVIKVVGVIGGIIKVDTKAAEAFSGSKTTYGGLKMVSRDGKRENFDRATALKNGPRDNPRSFKPADKPGNKPSDSQIKANKAFIENLKKKITELKSLSAKEGLSENVIKKYAEIASLTESYKERLKDRADPSLKNAAAKAKKDANDAAKAKKPADTPNKDTYEKIKNDIRKLNQRATDLAAKIRDIQRDKSLSAFDKEAKLKQYREALDKIKGERDRLNDRIENIENDIRRLQKELQNPDLDPKRRKELKNELDEKLKNRDNLKNEIKNANDKIRDIQDKLDRFKRENSALTKLRDFLRGLKRGALAVGLNLLPVLAGIGILGAATLPFIFAGPAAVTPALQPSPQNIPKNTDINQADFLKGKSDGYAAGIQDGTRNGSADGLKEAQRQYNEWASQNPEDRPEISIQDNSNVSADEEMANKSADEDATNNSEESA